MNTACTLDLKHKCWIVDFRHEVMTGRQKQCISFGPAGRHLLLGMYEFDELFTCAVKGFSTRSAVWSCDTYGKALLEAYMTCLRENLDKAALGGDNCMQGEPFSYSVHVTTWPILVFSCSVNQSFLKVDD